MTSEVNFVDTLLSDAGNNPSRLLQILCAIQQEYSWIAPHVVEHLSSVLQLPVANIYGVINFYAFLHIAPRGDFDILFSDNITDRMLHSQQRLTQLCQLLKVQPGIRRDDNRVSINTTSCTGLCDQGPAMLINGFAIGQLDESRIKTIAELINANTPLHQWPADFFRIHDNIHRRGQLLSESVTTGDALRRGMELGSETILKAIDDANLRGRGGAGFPTAKKWRLCQQAKAQQHYVICNADEGEPGTFKDRVLLNSYADDVIEGMTICALVIGAEKGLLYLRAEYRYLLEHLQQTLQHRRDAGLLGRNILGRKDFNFDIEIHLGAGAYICGEESALIESLEGKRGIPRKRPPFPVTHGYRNQPSVVNNVETFMAASIITLHGADWFRASGTENSTGSKILSISGDCERPGIYEYPYGVSIQRVFDDCGATDTQAVQLSGPAGITLCASEFHRCIAFDDIPTGGSFMIFNQQRDLLSMVQNFAEFFQHESCGFCTPCRVGTSLVKDLLRKVVDGNASRYDIDDLKSIANVMQQSSFCGLGSSAANALLDTLTKFPDLYTHRLAQRGHEPAFDIDAALAVSRRVTGRDDAGAHIVNEP